MKATKSENRDRRMWVVAAVLLAATLAIILFRVWPSESLEGATKRVADCLSNRDFQCLINYVSDDEIALIGIDRPTLLRIVESQMVGDYQDRMGTGGVEIEFMSDKSTALVTADWKKGGRQQYCLLELSEFEEGPRIVAFTQDFLYNAYLLRADIGDPRGVDKLIAVRDALVIAKQEMTPLGLKGWAKRSDDRSLVFQSWDDAIAAREALYRRVTSDSPPPRS